MNEQECAEAVVAWSRAVIDELKEGRPFISAQRTKLPDVMADIAEKSIRLADDRFPDFDFQQAAIKVFEVEAAYMVEHDDTSEGGDEQAQLRSFALRLEQSMLADSTLGGRVFAMSPVGATFNFRLPFVRYGDGTKGRQMTLSFAVADLIQQRGR